MIDVGCQESFTCDECLHGCDFYDDAVESKPTKQKPGKRKTGRAYRRRMRVKKLNRLMDVVSYCSTVSMYSGIDRTGLPAANFWGLWSLGIDDDDIRKAYIKRPKSSRYKGFYKNHSNRVIRRKGIVLPKGNQHHKIFDYWWTLY